MAEVWVNDIRGDDATGDGSRERPFRTLNRALGSTHAGDTVQVTAPNAAAVLKPADAWVPVEYTPGDGARRALAALVAEVRRIEEASPVQDETCWAELLHSDAWQAAAEVVAADSGE